LFGEVIFYGGNRQESLNSRNYLFFKADCSDKMWNSPGFVDTSQVKLNQKEKSMSNRKFSKEFRQEAVKQVTQRGYSVAEVSERLGVSEQSLYKWLKASKPVEAGQKQTIEQENLELKAELRRVQEERDILKVEIDILITKQKRHLISEVPFLLNNQFYFTTQVSPA